MSVGKGLVKHIREVFGPPDLALISFWVFAESLFGRAMRGLIAIERDLMGQSAHSDDGWRRGPPFRVFAWAGGRH